MQVSKNTTNKQYIHGDFDHDGVPNIDDKYPFDSRRKERVNKEVSLSKTLRGVERKRAEAKKLGLKYAKKHGFNEFRVKDTYSILDKFVRKGFRNPELSGDFIGFRSSLDLPRNKVRQKWLELRPKRVLEREDKYQTNFGTRNQYRAFHTNFVLGSGKRSFFAEAQFRTKKYGQLNDLMHERYKKGQKLTKKDILKATWLRKAGF